MLLTFQIIYQGEGEQDITFETSSLLTSRNNPSIILVKVLSSSVSLTIVGEIFQIYSVQTTGKC